MAQTQTQAGELIDFCENEFASPAVTKTIFYASRAYNIVAAQAIWDVVSTLAGSATLDLFHDTGTNAMGGGSTLLTQSSALLLTQSARTVNAFTLATSGTLAAGDRISAVITGSAGTLSNCTIGLQLQPR